MGVRVLSRQTLAVLRVLLEAPADKHYGLQIGKAAQLRTGSLYPILARLEESGWVRGEWEMADPRDAGRPRRRYYTLTPTGHASARQELEQAMRELSGFCPQVQLS